MSSIRGGWDGTYSFQPAMAPVPTPMNDVSPTYQRSSFQRSSHLTWGILSPHLADDIRDVHRSGGSVTWVSTSMICAVSITSDTDIVFASVVLKGH